ncbi:uncharacterized protein LOC109540561 isoform X1 [Dendroctonus ponderosae]
MSNNSFDFCKLCCASRGLINMFTGKCRSFRNILRKIIKETLCIEVELDDDFKSICINCLIDVTNFYYFKLNCHQTQIKLKHNGPIISVAKKPRIEKTHLDEIELPDIATITNVLDWLALKQKDDKNSPKFLEYEKAKVNSVACQTASIELRNQSCETTYIKLKNQSCQTTSIKMRVQSCQANLYRPAQTICKTEDVLTTSRPQKTTKALINKSVQCSLRSFKSDRPSVKNNLNLNKGCQTDLRTIKLEPNQTHCDLKKPFWKNDVLSPEAEYLQNQKLGTEPCSDKNQLSENSMQSVSKSITKACISPATSNLLQVKSKKSMKVTICQICDQSLYSAREVNKHKQTHMWCHICNKRFKTTKLAQGHIYSSHVRKHQDTENLNKRNWAAYVDLLKVDGCPSFKIEYPLAYQYLSDLSLKK